MFPSFAVQSVVRERPKRVDGGHGNLRDDWTSPEVLTISNCSIQPGATTEDMAHREGVLIQWTVYCAGHPDVQAGDRIKVTGIAYAIDGEPARWPSPSGALDNTVLLLKKWVG